MIPHHTREGAGSEFFGEFNFTSPCGNIGKLYFSDMWWYIQIYHDISWYIKIYHDISRYLVIQISLYINDISRYIMIYRDICWYLRIFLCIMIYLDISRYIVIYQDISWYIMIYPDISSTFFLKKSGFVKKNIEKYHDISEKYHDISWYIVIYHDMDHLHINDISWYIMIYQDISWYIKMHHKKIQVWFIMADVLTRGGTGYS